ncbi:choice-of-anchor M domain-containing protein [Micromonospora musae]|uniref:choice-of-anchor M domain-containing protein n=1 Tax=Micromonospora musae TaxID=1894970 RepID=UPI003414A1E0
MQNTFTRLRRVGLRPPAVAASLLALALVLSPTVAGAAPGDDPNLSQTIDANEPIVHGDDVIATGHVDMGPKFDGSTWKFLLNDDAHKSDANAQSVWRYPDETVLRVVDAAELTVPESDTYSFVGAQPGTKVWVVPQTQNPDVVWAGWNTQDPTVMQKIDRGATFSVDGVQGPGPLTVYLQSGDFGAPQVLWDSRKTGSQDVWVDTNTHTHANWVFTKPGVYLVRMTAAATLVDGSKVSDTELIRFAVGSSTSTDEALAASWKGAVPTGAAPAAASDAPTAAASGAAAGTSAAGRSPLVPVLAAAIAVVAVALVVGFSVAVVRGNRTRRRVLAAHGTAATITTTTDNAGGPAGPSDRTDGVDGAGR